MFIYEFMREVAKVLDTPDELIEGVAYSIAGSALVGRGYFMMPDQVLSNTYQILVSPPGWFHKSSCMRIGIRVLEKIGVPFLSGHASSEALAQECVNLESKGIHHGIIIYDEFKSFAAHLKKEYAMAIQSFMAEKLQRGLPVIITRRDSKDPSGVKQFKISSDFVLSFLASSTTAWLFDCIKTESIESGFFSRFFVIEAHKKQRRYRRAGRLDDSVIDALAKEIESVRNFYRNPVEFDMTPSAQMVYSKLYDKIEDESNRSDIQGLASFSSRLPLYAQKLALIHAMASKRVRIEEEDMLASAEMVMRSFESCRRIIRSGLSDSYFGRRIAKIEEYLESRGGSARVRDLYRAIGCRESELSEAMRFLLNIGRIQKFSQSSSRGPAYEVIRLVSEEERVIPPDIQAEENGAGTVSALKI